MAGFFQKLKETRQNRKKMNAELAQNTSELDATLKKINQEYANESARRLEQFAKDLVAAGGIDTAEADRITEEAERDAEQAKMLTRLRIDEATEESTRRAQKIIAKYQT